MTTQVLKNRLIQSIEHIQDDDLLRNLLEVVSPDDETHSEYQFSQKQMEMLEEAEEDFRHGRVHSHDYVMKQARKWLER